MSCAEIQVSCSLGTWLHDWNMAGGKKVDRKYHGRLIIPKDLQSEETNTNPGKDKTQWKQKIGQAIPTNWESRLSGCYTCTRSSVGQD